MTLRKPELTAPEIIGKDYPGCKLNALVLKLRQSLFYLREAKEYGAQTEPIAVFEKSTENFKRINAIELPKRGGN